jgi:hypothetical protein
MAAGVIGALIPVVAIVFGIACAMFGMYVDFLKKRELLQRYHAERMAAIEKGVELPPLPDALLKGGWRSEPLPARNRRIGLILLFLGIAITLGLWGEGLTDFWWGLVPAGLGVAYLLSAFLEFREQRLCGNAPGNGSPPGLTER